MLRKNISRTICSEEFSLSDQQSDAREWTETITATIVPLINVQRFRDPMRSSCVYGLDRQVNKRCESSVPINNVPTRIDFNSSIRQ